MKKYLPIVFLVSILVSCAKSGAPPATATGAPAAAAPAPQNGSAQVESDSAPDVPTSEFTDAIAAGVVANRGAIAACYLSAGKSAAPVDRKERVKVVLAPGGEVADVEFLHVIVDTERTCIKSVLIGYRFSTNNSEPVTFSMPLPPR